MSLEQIYLWLKSLNLPIESTWCGQLKTKPLKALGVYNSKREFPRQKAVGGAQTTHRKGITLLVHYSKSAREAEECARNIYDTLAQQDRPNIDGHIINYIELPYEEPISVGTDDDGIQEYVIDFNIYY